jgi:hypothetical protein
LGLGAAPPFGCPGADRIALHVGNVLAYNIKRVIAIIRVGPLLQAIRA